MDPECSTTAKRRKISTLIATDPNNDNSCSEFEQSYAEGYLARLELNLDKYLYVRVLSILNEFEQNSSNVVECYNTLSDLLSPYPDLQYGFLPFLCPEQALQCDKMNEYLQLCQMKEFLHKLNVHFKKCPQQIRKVTDCLYQLSEEPNVSLEIVRSNMIPLLKNNTPLIESFLQLLPNEKPPDGLFLDNWEDVNIDSEDSDCEEVFEIPKLDESSLDGTDDAHCLHSCTTNSPLCCTFHDVNFINGRVYIHKGKIIRPAKLIFDGVDENDILRRLTSKHETEAPKCTPRGQKKSETIQNDSACTESDEEQCGSSASKKRMKKRKRSTSVSKTTEISNKLLMSDNTDETELSDDCIHSEFIDVSTVKMEQAPVEFGEFNESSSQNLNSCAEHVKQNQDEHSLLKRPNLCNSELVFTTSDAPLILDNVNNID